MSSDEKKFTAEELKAFNGQEEGKPIYLAIRGVVYDVTAGANFYGKGASYNGLTGREAGRALAVMKVDVMETNLDDLTAEDLEALDAWIRKLSEKYPKVGVLV